MAKFKAAVMTNKGIELLARSIAEEFGVEFTRMEIGSGLYLEAEKDKTYLQKQEKLKAFEKEFGFSSVSVADKNAIMLKTLLTNQDIDTGFRITEMGIFARGKKTEETEILYSIAVAVEADYFPSKESPVEILQEYYTKVSNAETVTIDVNASTPALAEDLINHIADKNNPHEVTKEQIGLGNVDNTSDIDKPVSTAQQQAIESAYTQATGYTDKTIGDLIGGAPETLDTLKEVADAIKENESVVDALDAAIGKKADQAEVDGHNRNNTIHITALERTNWNDANTKKHTHGNKNILDGITAALVSAWNGVITGLAAHKTSGDHDERYYTKNETNSKIAGVTNYSGQTGSHANNTWIDGNNTSIEWVVDNLPVGATRLFLYLPNDNDRNAGLLSYEWGHAKVINNGAHAEIEYTALTNNKKYCKWKCNSWNQDWLPYSAYNTPRTNGIISDVLLLSNFDGSKNNQTFLYNKNQSKNCPSGAEFGFRFVLTTADVTHNGSINAMIVLYDMNSTIYINTIQGGGWLGWRKLGSTPI